MNDTDKTLPQNTPDSTDESAAEKLWSANDIDRLLMQTSRVREIDSAWQERQQRYAPELQDSAVQAAKPAPTAASPVQTTAASVLPVRKAPEATVPAAQPAAPVVPAALSAVPAPRKPIMPSAMQRTAATPLTDAPAASVSAAAAPVPEPIIPAAAPVASVPTVPEAETAENPAVQVNANEEAVPEDESTAAETAAQAEAENPEAAQAEEASITEIDTEPSVEAEAIQTDTPPAEAETDTEDEKEVLLLRTDLPKNEKRTRFLRTLSGEEDEPTEREPVEKPGIILEKSPFDKTADLQQLPTVVSADQKLRESREAEKTRLAMPTPAAALPPPEPEFDSDQLVLSDFEEAPIPDQISEEELEQQLLEKKQEKVKSFRLTAEHLAAADRENMRDEMQLDPFELEDSENETADTEAPATPHTPKKNAPPRIEYREPGQAQPLLVSLRRAEKGSGLRAAVFGLGLVISLLAGLLPPLLETFSVELAAPFAANGTVTLAANLVLLAVTGLLCVHELISGLRMLLRGRPDHDSIVSLAFFTALAVNAALLALPAAHSAPLALTTAPLCFAFLMNVRSKQLIYRRTADNLEFCEEKRESGLFSVRPIDSQEDSGEIGRGLLMDYPILLYSGKIKFPAGFMRESMHCETAEPVTRRSALLALGGALLAAIGFGIVTKNVYSALSLFACALCLLLPLCYYPALCALLYRTNKKLRSANAAIIGLDAAQDMRQANGVVVDSTDLYDRALCDMHGMRDYKTIRVDDVMLYAAALVLRSGGPLSQVFDKVIVGRRELLPDIHEFAYEDKMGLSGVIHGQKVFLGNRALLNNHSIEAPAKATQERYMRDGRKLLYLAVAGRIAAMFVVSYHPDKRILDEVAELPAQGMYLLVNSCDPNITEEMICGHFSLPTDCVKVISARAGRGYSGYRNAVRKKGFARLLHDGAAVSAFQLIAATERLNAAMRVCAILQYVLYALGLGLAAVLPLRPSWLPYFSLFTVLFQLCAFGLLHSFSRRANE